jgi:hypothetical protein
MFVDLGVFKFLRGTSLCGLYIVHIFFAMYRQIFIQAVE